MILLLDANCVNARQRDPALNQIEKWHRDRIIVLEMAQASYEEALAGGSPRRGRKVMGSIYAMPLPESVEEKEQLRRIEAILFPKGCRDANQRNDVEIVFTAVKYHAVLVTRDGGSRSQPGGLLGNRECLFGEGGVRVMRPEETVSWITEKIEKRDQLARQIAGRHGIKLPEWVGKD